MAGFLWAPCALLALLFQLPAATEDCQQDVPCLLKALTLDEKLQFFAGDLDAIDHVSGVSRLNIPDINMGDGPNGVANTISGTATSFPCNMAAGDTFDPELTRKYATAMAKEFKAKGKNMILGPGVNFARVPTCGRQDEYITGDDPVLGAELVKAFVKGALDEHVMVSVKHFGNNEQETNRNQWNANPDAYLQMELYMKPFFAAIQAGAASLMCAYNMVNGVHACKNKGIMQAVKKAGDSFWIVSDWGAVYPDAANGGVVEYINAGLDMEMGTHDDATCGGHLGPDVQETKYGGAGYCNRGDYMLPDKMKQLVKEGKVSQARVDETVSRVLGALKTAGLLDPEVQAEFPAYAQQDLHSKWFGPLSQKDVRTQHSRAVAQELATKAMVLLQNSGSILPLKATEKLEMYGCGDEVHFRAESGSAAGTEPNIPQSRCEANAKTACPFPADGVKAAGVKLQEFRLADANSGPRDGGATAVICLTAAAKNSEGTDRSNLDLLGKDIPFDRFKRSIVYVVAPGAVTMPFAAKVGAILFSSLPGEMGGAAFADILLGKASPTGHLSLTMPNSAQETAVTVQSNSDDYKEGLEVGYRWYQVQNKHPNFAFGWGLSYAKYMQVVNVELNTPDEDMSRPSVTVTLCSDSDPEALSQMGSVDQVVQIYVQHKKPNPRSFKQLAGFAKLRNLQAGKPVQAEIEFDAPQTWSSKVGDKNAYDAGWVPVTEYTVFISLHGVEKANPVFCVKVEDDDDDDDKYTVTPEYAFKEDGPMQFDQDLVAWERAQARNIPIEKPTSRKWGKVSKAVDGQRLFELSPVEDSQRWSARWPVAMGILALGAAAAAVTVRRALPVGETPMHSVAGPTEAQLGEEALLPRTAEA